MSFYDAIRVGASGAAGDLEIERSLRFDYDATPQLKRTGSSTSSSYTVSMWFKYTGVQRNEFNLLFSLGQSNDANSAFMGIDNNDRFILYSNGGYQFTSTRVYRDPSAWYHFTLSVNSNSYTLYINNESIDTGTIRSLDTSSDGLRIGIQYGNYYPFNGYIADFYLIDGSALTPSSFTKTNIETGQLIPKKYSGSFGTSGAHLLFKDNSGTTATTLGKDTSGNGNNFTPSGFSVSAGAGNDSLEDTPTNNFATINSVFRADGFDGNGSRIIKDGNLAISGATNNSPDALFAASIPFPLSGKWYVEANVTTLGTTGGNEGGPLIGITDMPFTDTNSKSKMIRADGLVATTGNAGGAGSSQFTSSFGGSIAQGDVWQLAYDADNRYLYFGKNNNWANGSGSYNQSNFSNAQAYATQPTAGVQQVYVVCTPYSSASSISYQLDFNFGQRAFAHTPPTGYEKLNTTNLPDPTILLPNKYFDNLLYTGNGSTNTITGLNFQPDFVWLKSRSSSTDNHYLVNSLSGVQKALFSNLTASEASDPNGLTAFSSTGFTLGSQSQINTNTVNHVAWNWDAGDTDSATYTVKVVSDSGNKYRFNDFGTSAVTLDLAEGGTYTFDQSDSSMSSHPMQLSTTANGTHGGGSAYSTGVTYQLDGSTVTASAFISGFSSASSRKLIITVAASAPTLYYYCYYHSGMGGQANTNSTLGSSNFDGNIQSTVKANATAGFSIVTYTGNGSGGSGARIGHGLGVAPKGLIVKNREDAQSWEVHAFEEIRMYLNSTDADFASAQFSLTATDIRPANNNARRNENGTDYVAFVFSEVEGYSKLATYVGNGSTEGVFVFCGFRPAWILIKSITGSKHWVMNDTARNPHNVANKTFLANATNAEDSGSSFQIDILSNGFKIRTDGVHVNTNAGKHLFLAFAEAPFKNSRAR